MRQFLLQYLPKMLRSTKVTGMFLGLGSVVMLGAMCTKIISNNTTNNNSTVSSTNTGSNVDVGTDSIVNANTNEKPNIQTNTNSDTNTNSTAIDTSDWLTYTTDQYGFSFRYPKEWYLKKVDSETIFLTNFDTDQQEGSDLSGTQIKIDVLISSNTGQTSILESLSPCNIKGSFILLDCYIKEINRQKVIQRERKSEEEDFYSSAILFPLENSTVSLEAYMPLTTKNEKSLTIINNIFSSITFNQ